MTRYFNAIVLFVFCSTTAAFAQDSSKYESVFPQGITIDIGKGAFAVRDNFSRVNGTPAPCRTSTRGGHSSAVKPVLISVSNSRIPLKSRAEPLVPTSLCFQ